MLRQTEFAGKCVPRQEFGNENFRSAECGKTKILLPSEATLFAAHIDFQKNNLTASSVGDIRVSMISSLLPFGRLRAKPCEINFLKIYTLLTI